MPKWRTKLNLYKKTKLNFQSFFSRPLSFFPLLRLYIYEVCRVLTLLDKCKLNAKHIKKDVKSPKSDLKKEVILCVAVVVFKVIWLQQKGIKMCPSIYEILRHHQTKQQCQGAQQVPRNHLSVAEFSRSPFHRASVHGWASITELCRWLAESDITSDMRVAEVLIYCWFVFSRARGFLWVHHRVVDGPDVELRSIYIWGEGTVGPSNWEPDLCQPAVLWEHKEQGTVRHER